jgi:hypothetical protein
MPNETHRASLRYNISDFFSSLLGIEVKENDFRFAEDPIDYRKNAVLSQRLSERRGRSPRFLVHPAFRAFLEISEP